MQLRQDGGAPYKLDFVAGFTTVGNVCCEFIELD